MRLSGWMMMSAGLVLSAAAANAQGVAPYTAPYEVAGSRYSAVSDFEGPPPYAAMPPGMPSPRYYGAPMLLPPQEVYRIVRDNGFSPLGIPQQRGFVYMIAVIDRDGYDGRLVVDARTGRILHFRPADRMGGYFNEDLTGAYGSTGPLPPVDAVRGPPRPPGYVPQVASRNPSAVPLPRPAPPHASEMKPLAAKPAPEPVQQSAAVQAKPADPAPPAAAPAVIEAKPAAPQIQPTQPMPKMQGLE
jgi:hypothetical protein